VKAFALFSIPNGVQVIDIDKPQIGPGEFLVKVRACALCQTDVKIVSRGRHFLIDLLGLPLVLGHEVAGEVVEVGRDVEGVAEGDRVAVAPFIPCGKCSACRTGTPQFCEKIPLSWIRPGGFSEYIKVSGENAGLRVARIPPNVSFEEASLTEPLACCLNGIIKSGIHLGDDVAIVGAGPVGLTLLLLAKIAGAGQIIMVEMDKQRIECAKRFGADEIIDPGVEDPSAAVRRLTYGKGADVVIEAVGSIKTYDMAIHLARAGGRVTFFGGAPGGSKFEIPTDLLHYMDLTLTGAVSFSPDTFHKSLKLIAAGKVDVKKLITHRYSTLEALKESVLSPGNTDEFKLKKVMIM
jgi:L-iditol 2-dehydrogenase